MKGNVMNKEQLAVNYFNNNKLNLEMIINDYYNYIKSIINNSTNISEEDCEEIISDVFYIVWKNSDRIDKNLNLRPYIAQITKNIVYKNYHSNQREVKTDTFENMEYELFDKFNLEKCIEEKEINEIVLNNIEKMNKLDAEIFRKYYFEDKSIKQISKELNISKSNVKIKLHRTRKKVKELLKKGGY